MRILSFNPFSPWPPVLGMDVIYSNILRLQAEDHEVTVVTLERTGQEASHVPDSLNFYAVPMPNLKSPLHRVIYRAMFQARGLTAGIPVPTFYNTPTSALRLLEELVLDNGFDLVEIHHSTAASFAKVAPGLPRLLYMYDLHFRAWESRALAASGIRGLHAKRLTRRYLRHEIRWLDQYAAILTGQESDRECLQKLCPPGRIVEVMPNPVEIPRIHLHPQSATPTVLFLGAFKHAANVDGVARFLQDWPKVRRAVPSARFVIVGPNPPQQIRKFDRRDGVEVRGFAPDLDRELAEATVCIAPIRTGSGIKVKMLQFLAAGKPIVATPRAAEGMNLTSGQEALIADIGESFCDCIVRILTSTQVQAHLGESARRFAIRHYGDAAARECMRRIYDVALG